MEGGAAMKTLRTYLRPYYFRMAVGLVIKFSGTVIDLFLPWILSYLVDTVAPTKNIPSILFWGGMMVLCAVAALVTNVIANRMACWVAAQCTQSVRHDLFCKVSYLSANQIDRYTIPSLESRLTSDTYNLHSMIAMSQRLGVRAPILLVGGLCITFVLEPVLATVLLCVIPFLAVLVFCVSKRGLPLFTSLQQATDEMVRTVRENISGVRVIKALAKTQYEQQRFSIISRKVSDREKSAGMTMALTNPMMNLLLNTGLTLVVLLGAYRVNAGFTQPGTIIAFTSYFTIILTATLSITRIFTHLTKGMASSKRIFAVLNETQEMPVEYKEATKTGQPYLVFDNVSFSYHNTKKDHVSNLSFSLEKGQSLGIIGATGSGKSTIIQLLMRMYDPTRGTIWIGGRDVSSIAPDELYRMFGVVFQNDVLFSDTIYENIDFGRNLSPQRIYQAAVDAQAIEFIESLADRFEHRLTAKATNLSGGQKQRLLIARALAAKPDILILDDSSSALDYKTDARLRQVLRTSYANTTSIIIAQRVSSISHCNKILVMDNGAIIGCGTHQQLIKSCDIYREIAHLQMGGEEK